MQTSAVAAAPQLNEALAAEAYATRPSLPGTLLRFGRRDLVQAFPRRMPIAVSTSPALWNRQPKRLSAPRRLGRLSFPAGGTAGGKMSPSRRALLRSRLTRRGTGNEGAPSKHAG